MPRRINRFTLLAAEALSEAGQMADPTSKQIMLDVAASYLKLAGFAERRKELGAAMPRSEGSDGRDVDLASVDNARPRYTDDEIGEA